jgi:hypothetical protein
MVGGITFGATMRGFCIVVVAFFSGMVMADGGGQGREGCEGSRDRERAARRRREACFVREPAGVVVAPTGPPPPYPSHLTWRVSFFTRPATLSGSGPQRVPASSPCPVCDGVM